MTPAEWFVNEIQKYYGAAYPEDEREKYIPAYLRKRGITEKEARRLFALCVENIEREYRTPPSVGKLRPLVRIVLDERPWKPHPALRPLPTNARQIEEDAGFDPSEALARLRRAVGGDS